MLKPLEVGMLVIDAVRLGRVLQLGSRLESFT